MEIIGTRRVEEDASGGCPACGDPPYTSFNWQHAQQRGDDKMRALVSMITRVRPLKFGFLHQCSACRRYWVLDEDQHLIDRVPPDREDLLFEWDSAQLKLTPEQIQVFETVGGTGPDQYGNGRERIEIPCAVELDNGTLFDPAVLWVTKKPPIIEDLPKVALWQGVKSVRPTDYALPLKVRARTLHAEEVRMGFAPTMVSSRGRHKLVLNGSPCLISHRGIKGKDLRLLRLHFGWGGLVPLAESPDIETVHFFADWFSGAETLNKA